MIDWWFVGVNALWILGLSIILAAFSYHNWLRRETRHRWKEVFARPWWRLPFSLGMLLFCLGLGLGRGIAWWERTLWGLLAASFAWQTVTTAIHLRRGVPTAAPTQKDTVRAASRDLQEPPDHSQAPP